MTYFTIIYDIMVTIIIVQLQVISICYSLTDNMLTTLDTPYHAGVQVTVVTQQPSVPTMLDIEAKPNNYLVLSIINMLFCFFILGLIALIFSLQVCVIMTVYYDCTCVCTCVYPLCSVCVRAVSACLRGPV